MKNAIKRLVACDLIFWDFDGIIKDSLEVKEVAFGDLFHASGKDIVAKVRAHHNENSGISRFEKIPLYLDWSGITPTPEIINEFCNRFSNLTLQRIIDSPWVPGIREYLMTHHSRQSFILLTAMPQVEIEHIIDILGISGLFQQVFGSPAKKIDIIARVLQERNINRNRVLVVGDTETDILAAKANRVNFLLRRTPYNQQIQNVDKLSVFDDFSL